MANLSEQSFLVELKDVDKDFIIQKPVVGDSKSSITRIHALSRVSLKLQAGEFVFLTGPSGAGKSTLLRLILGLENPSSGEVYTLGKNVARMNESERRELRRQVGIIFQDHRLLDSLNVYDNIEIPLSFMGLSTDERKKRIFEILEIVQMTHHAYSAIQNLSAGEKQRIGIARALVASPALVVADEPTGNLDPLSARSLIRMLRELKGHGTTILIATHDMSLVRDFGGRVLEIVSGTVPTENRTQKAYKVPSFWKAPQHDL